MPSFGRRSKKNLSTAHFDLQLLFTRVVKYFDCSVLCGFRDKESQNEAFHSGRSKVLWPNSKHNSKPSYAIDVAPYYTGEGVPWDNRERFIIFAGFVLGLAASMDIELRWGGDWDSDRKLNDQSFFDGVHFELVH